MKNYTVKQGYTIIGKPDELYNFNEFINYPSENLRLPVYEKKERLIELMKQLKEDYHDWETATLKIVKVDFFIEDKNTNQTKNSK